MAVIDDREIDRIARRILARHGPRAAIVAAERLNRCIDRADWTGRDTWAQVVHRIHEDQGTTPR